MIRWLLLALVVIGVLIVQEVRVRWAIAERDALHEQQFRAVLGAIEIRRQEQEAALGTLSAERAKLRADIAAHRRRADALARQTTEAADVVERVGREGEALVARARTDPAAMQDIVARWSALGWTLIPAPRPQPPQP